MSMGKAIALLHFARMLLHSGGTLVLCLLMAWTSISRMAPCTPRGVQCPTASVQWITAPVKDCCGRVIGAVARKPRPGDPQFVQCRCAEKHSQQQQAVVGQRAPSFTVLAQTAAAVETPLLPRAVVDVPAPTAGVVERSSAPLIPPPSLG